MPLTGGLFQLDLKVFFYLGFYAYLLDPNRESKYRLRVGGWERAGKSQTK